MKVKIKTIFYLAALVIVFASLQNTEVFAQRRKAARHSTAQKPKVIELNSARGADGQDAQDSNIKRAAAPNNPNKKAARSRDAAITRGSGKCKIVFDNYTVFDISIFVDGNYRGTVGADGIAQLYVAPKPDTIVYARADFSDGAFLFWGPETYGCGANEYVYFKLKNKIN